MAFVHKDQLLLIIFIYLSCLLSGATTTDTLKQGQTITDGQTLVSAGQIFEFGFFSPENSSKRYVGIWYMNTSLQTILWVANREVFIANFTGSINLSSTGGGLVLLNGSGNSIWSTNLSVLPDNSSVQLLDSGNLAVQQIDGTVLWESFDHPTDTFIPGMKISLNLTSNQQTLLTSWKSADDPSTGNFSLGLDPSGSAQLFIWNGKVPRWRSGQWDGQTFIGTTLMRPLYIYGFKLTNDNSQGIMYYSFTSFNDSLLRFVLDWDGIETTSMLVEETNGNYWETVWQQPLTDCEIYGKCGSNGICSNGDTPICACLKGFKPKIDEEWSNGNWSSGCIRTTELACEINSTIDDGFFSLQGVKLPDFSNWASTVGSESGCQTACANNCSCRAYAYVSGIGCMTWQEQLIDISQFSQGGNDLYIKLSASELDNKSNKWKIPTIVCAVGLFFLISCSLLGWKYNKRLRELWERRRQHEETSIATTHPTTTFQAHSSGSTENGEKRKEDRENELPLFSFDCVVTATNNFTKSNKLGEGGFGSVYKGMLPGGQEIAVKRLSRSSGQGLEEFKNEVILIAKLQHRNLVGLLGCCIQGEEKILVYEYMPNKSLDAILFDPSKKTLLDWRRRFNIIEGIARGILYLHRDSRLRIVHRDLKASNILLDGEMNPRISDFGMARIFGGDQNEGNTNRIVGTFGYMAPEYAMEGLISIKSDVYSFGILVLEIITGQRNSSFRDMENSMNIVGHAWLMWNEDRAVELIDSSINMSCPIPKVLRCIQVALLCLQDRAHDRPDMASVINMMGREDGIIAIPRQPTFISEGITNQTESIATGSSTYDVTITTLHGR